MDEKKELENNSQSSEPLADNLPDIDIPAVRTYKNDINQTVHRDKISTAKILLAEQKQKEKESEKFKDVSAKRPTNILAIFFGILFIIAALGLIGYFGYNKINKQTFVPIEIKTSFLFVFDGEKMIDTSKDKADILKDVEKSMQEVSLMKDNVFIDFVFFDTNKETNAKERITSSEFFSIYNIKLPTLVSRSISKDFTYGFYKTRNKLEPFLVVGIVDYENLYTSMFLWEQTLALDIKDLFPVLKDLFDISKIRNNLFLPNNPVANNSSSTTSATTTNSATTSIGKIESSTSTIATTSPEQDLSQEQILEQKEVINRSIRFVDVVFSNKDARAVRDTTGNPFFYYAFIERDKIIFAQDSKLLAEIIRKIKEKSLVR